MKERQGPGQRIPTETVTPVTGQNPDVQRSRAALERIEKFMDEDQKQAAILAQAARDFEQGEERHIDAAYAPDSR